MKVFLFLFFLLLSSHLLSNELLIGHDKFIYNPIDYAKKTVSFSVEIEGLAKEVSALKSYGTIKSILFDVNVNKLNKYEIKVVGIPPKLNDLSKNLKAKVIPYLELLFPQGLNKFYRSYQQKNSKNKVVAIDKTYLKPIKESYLLFQKNGLLLENKLKTAQGTQIINFEYENGEPGLNRALLKKVNRKIIFGPSHLISNTVIEYSKKGSKPYPTKITTEFLFENKENNLNSDRVSKLGEKYIIRNFNFN